MRERIIVPHLGSGESRVKMFITYVYVDTHFKVCAHTHYMIKKHNTDFNMYIKRLRVRL